MNLQQIEELMEKYGFAFILEQHDLTELAVLSLLQDLGYINLEYMEGEE
jgi:hypothetical protein